MGISSYPHILLSRKKQLMILGAITLPVLKPSHTVHAPLPVDMAVLEHKS